MILLFSTAGSNSARMKHRESIIFFLTPVILKSDATKYTRRLTGMMIKKRQEEFSHLPEIRVREVEKDEVIKLGNLTVRFFGVTHTVPDSMGIIIETPWGDVVFTGDIKLDHENGEPTEEEHQGFSVFH